MNAVPTFGMQSMKHLPVLKALSDEELMEFQMEMTLRVIPKHAWIYQVGQPSETLYFLDKGMVKIGAHAEDGREVIKQILYPATMFGEMGVLGEKCRQDFAVAFNEEVRLYSMPVDSFRRWMRNTPPLTMQMLHWVGGQLRRTERRLESLIFKDARERIVDFLKDTAQKRGKSIGYETLIKHSLTQQDIANITGTSRQTVTSVLNELRKSNLIHFNRRSILIRDLNKLG
jgi:CRP/FNR family cyclic AMP-dependent transcriptional regulator